MKRSQGDKPHIVISTKELQDITILRDYLANNKAVLDYYVAVEYGDSGHPHLECFSTWSKEVRQDKLKAVIVKLYNIDDYHGKMNTKIVFNHLDPDPMYGYGYSSKENPKVYYTTLSQEYLDKCKTYYQDHQDAVNMLKKEQRLVHKDKMMTVDKVALDYLGYVKKFYNDNFATPDIFDKFMLEYQDIIPFSMYQKINQEKLTAWVNTLKSRGTSLDCAPSPKPHTKHGKKNNIL